MKQKWNEMENIEMEVTYSLKFSAPLNFRRGQAENFSKHLYNSKQKQKQKQIIYRR